MSSRDGSGQSDRPRRSTQSRRGAEPRRQSQRQGEPSWDIDPAEIDRYLSGRPSRDQETKGAPRPRSRTESPGGTAGQLNRLQRAVNDRRSPQRAPSQRTSRSASAGRQQFAEPDYDVDDAYDDGRYRDPEYQDDEVLEQEQAPARPRQNRPQPQPRYQTSTRQAQPPRQRQQPARQPQPVYEEYDDPVDEELYADDPYLTYDHEEDWEVPASRRTPRSRPKVRFNSSNIPRLSVPQSVSGAAVLNDTPSVAMMGTAILGTAVMAIVVSNRLELLPATIPTHVSASGVEENIRGRGALWSVPLLTIALSLMNVVTAWFLATIDIFLARFMLGAALLVQFIAWIAIIRYLW